MKKYLDSSLDNLLVSVLSGKVKQLNYSDLT